MEPTNEEKKPDLSPSKKKTGNPEEEEEDVPIGNNPFYKHLKNIDVPLKHEKNLSTEGNVTELRRVTFCGAFQENKLNVPIKSSTRKSILKTNLDER